MDRAITPPRRARRRNGGVTLHDVAKLAGVAPITASRALNMPGQVSKEVLARVTDANARTGYVPNRLAGSLASARSRLVAAFVPTTTVRIDGAAMGRIAAGFILVRAHGEAVAERVVDIGFSIVGRASA